VTCDDSRNPWLINFFNTTLKTRRLYIRGDGDDEDSTVGRATGRWHKVVGLPFDNRHGDIIAECQIKNKRAGLPPFYKKKSSAIFVYWWTNLLLLNKEEEIELRHAYNVIVCCMLHAAPSFFTLA
jgi:hypothetical protein